MNWLEQEELNAEYFAREDYLREAYGPSAVDHFDDGPEGPPPRPLEESRADYRAFREEWIRNMGGRSWVSPKDFDDRCRARVELEGATTPEEVGERWRHAAWLTAWDSDYAGPFED
jgi:hypothetical protein